MRKLFDYLLFSLVIISSSHAERGDLLSYELLATRSVINAQTYIDNELAQIVSNMFSIEFIPRCPPARSLTHISPSTPHS